MSDGADPPYLASLNPGQRRAVSHEGGPLLILAGAGSGKTRVITAKIAWLIRERGVDPRSILAVTFTNRAAREMAGRAAAIDERAAGATLRTFHSFGAWFLRRHGASAGLAPGFVIYDDSDAAALLSSIMKGARKGDVRDAARKISRAKDCFLSPWDAGLAAMDDDGEFRDLYRRYEQKLAEIGNVDFGDLIKKPVEILRGSPETAERLRRRFSVVMVDEYQDSNVAQFELLKELAGPGVYVCVVGDDDQSIYRFRGAEVKNIVEFPKRFPGAEIIRLESNYRSTAPILRVASSVVGRNGGRLGKTLRAERGGGKPPTWVPLPNQEEEAGFCASLIADSVERGDARWSDWAALYRANEQSRGFEAEFLRRSIPYRIVGSLKFYEREEIKDALALLAFLANPRDEVAFRRIANKPARGLGAVALDRLVEAAAEEGGGLLEATRAAASKSKAKAKKGMEAFVALMDGGRALLESGANGVAATGGKKPAARNGVLAPGEGLSQCVAWMATESGLVEHHLTRDEIAGDQRLGNLQGLVNDASRYAGTFEGLWEFLEIMELDRAFEERAKGAADDSPEDKVTLITFHNAKGLEFRRVIMTGLEQGVFPRDDKKGEDLEEERRLFYVGATRAMDELYLSSCAVRRIFGRTMGMEPSIFLREIDVDCLRVLGSAPRAFGASVPPGRVRASVPPAETEAEAAAGWRRGQRFFHGDRGHGCVIDVSDSDDGPVVRVRFDSGGETRFHSDFQGSAFEKTGDDE